MNCQLTIPEHRPPRPTAKQCNVPPVYYGMQEQGVIACTRCDRRSSDTATIGGGQGDQAGG